MMPSGRSEIFARNLTFVVNMLYLIYSTCPLSKKVPIPITYEILKVMVSYDSNIEYMFVLKKLIDSHAFSFGVIYGLKSISFTSYLAINRAVLI